MIFKNCTIFKLIDGQSVDLGDLESAIYVREPRDPSGLELSRAGFAPVSPHGPSLLTFRINDDTPCALLTVEYRSRALPAAAVRHEWTSRIAQIEHDEDRRLSRRERYKLKDDIYTQMIPNAFITTKRVQAIIIGRYFIVDSTSQRAAEAVVSLVREALGSFPVVPWSLTGSSSAFMKTLRSEGHIGAFELSSQRNTALFKDADRSTVTTRDFDLQRDEANMLSMTSDLQRLGISYGQEVDFVLSDDLALRRLRFSETFKEQASDDAGEAADADSMFEASAIIFAGTMEILLNGLAAAIGDEPSDDEDL